MNDRLGMNCEEFEIVGLDFEREGSLNEESRQRASQHVRVCVKCAALQSSWSVARMELAALGADTRDVAVPRRVEARVLQQFRLKHRSRRDRRIIKAGIGALAAAAVIVFSLGVWNLHQWRLRSLATTAPQNSLRDTEPAISALSVGNAAMEAPSETLSASNFSNNDGGDFTQIPGATFYSSEEGAVVRLGMQRASLAGFGLPVNEESAGDWIEVDVLVAADGSPQAYRLPQ